jgi:hypothetical protein
MVRRNAALATFAILIAAAATLLAMGRPPICTCGAIDLWVGSADSPRTSQMLADWYSPSHVIHGILFYAALWLVARRWPVEWRFVAALALETAWELLENTPWAIDRYREGTIALGYSGDSILNTMSDIAMMALGFWLARKVPIWAAAALVVLLELAALAAVRDNLTLNVWMFVWPTEWVRAWQSGA